MPVLVLAVVYTSDDSLLEFDCSSDTPGEEGSTLRSERLEVGAIISKSHKYT